MKTPATDESRAFDALVGKRSPRGPLLAYLLSFLMPGTVRAIRRMERDRLRTDLKLALMIGPLSQVEKRIDSILCGANFRDIQIEPPLTESEFSKTHNQPDPPPSSFVSDLKKIDD